MPDEEHSRSALNTTEETHGGEATRLSRPQIFSPSPHETSHDHAPLAARLEQITITKVHQGQIPPTEYLREVNEIVPNGAERIMAMSEGHAAHSQLMERLELEASVARDKGELARSNSGLIAGFPVSMSFGLGPI